METVYVRVPRRVLDVHSNIKWHTVDMIFSKLGETAMQFRVPATFINFFIFSTKCAKSFAVCHARALH